MQRRFNFISKSQCFKTGHIVTVDLIECILLSFCVRLFIEQPTIDTSRLVSPALQKCDIWLVHLSIQTDGSSVIRAAVMVNLGSEGTFIRAAETVPAS
ncbi:hypothetical protein AVEN_1329-1 [Araneus ventricosus]|uniref:Uncharacterized protein n=1 Tax=Araneus ventricosus TaxID=182803 RepID=A0A4Y2D4T4_ARAVE|nr:hypothetical protein AVEN_1329-1 [Araneus ventricosus]